MDVFSSSLSTFTHPFFLILFLIIILILSQGPTQFQIFKKLSHEPVQTHMPSSGTPVQLTLLSWPDNTPTRKEESKWDYEFDSTMLIVNMWWKGSSNWSFLLYYEIQPSTIDYWKRKRVIVCIACLLDFEMLLWHLKVEADEHKLAMVGFKWTKW